MNSPAKRSWPKYRAGRFVAFGFTGLVARITIHGTSFIRANSPTNRLRSLLAERRHLAERHAAQDKLLLQDIRFLQQAGATSRRKTARSTKRSRK
ncbi:MAG: hypothetical protein M5U25_11430 [Planctomycetota bacterium]|nr:hypothetical protein [Planctomycetota bacterium]